MNVIEYIKTDISSEVTSSITAKQLANKHKTIQFIPLGEDESVFILLSTLDYNEFEIQKSEGIELPKVKCPVTGIIGLAQIDEYESNLERPNDLKDLMSRVQLFHKVFGHPIGEKITVLTPEMRLFRDKLMREELDEFLGSPTNPDQFDALVDQLYILLGSFIVGGYSGECVEAGFLEVQDSNMTKLENGKPIYYPEGHEKAGKIAKGSNYREPNLLAVINKFTQQTF